jgi:hypothetical protein
MSTKRKSIILIPLSFTILTSSFGFMVAPYALW